MIENWFDHTCSIYHLTSSDNSPGYALPASKAYTYPDEPDIPGQTCHFGVANATSVSMVQNEPQASYNVRVKLGLPAGTDIRLNDKIIHLETGLEYTAEQPQNIRGHHIAVYVHRQGQQAVL